MLDPVVMVLLAIVVIALIVNSTLAITRIRRMERALKDLSAGIAAAESKIAQYEDGNGTSWAERKW